MASFVIPGLYYYRDCFSEAEEKRLIEFLENESTWFSVGNSDNSRKVLHYGFTYNYSSAGKLEQAPAFSETIDWLRSKIREIHSVPTELELNQCIVNKYLPGQGIAPHVDKKTFKDFICCVTVGSGATMEFTKENETNTLYTEPRSLYIMSGEARYEWKHGMRSRKSDIVEGKKIMRDTRYSLTFRTVA